MSTRAIRHVAHTTCQESVYNQPLPTLLNSPSACSTATTMKPCAAQERTGSKEEQIDHSCILQTLRWPPEERVRNKVSAHSLGEMQWSSILGIDHLLCCALAFLSSPLLPGK